MVAQAEDVKGDVMTSEEARVRRNHRLGKKKQTSPFSKVTRRPVSARGGKPRLSSRGKSPGSVIEKEQPAKSSMPLPVSDSRKTMDSRMSSFTRSKRKTALAELTENAQVTRESLFHAF